VRSGDSTTARPLVRMPRRLEAAPGELATRPDLGPLWESLGGEGDLPEAKPDPVVMRRDAILRRALGLVDVIAAAVAMLFAVLAIGSSIGFQPWALLLLPLMVVINKATGLYDRDQHLLRKTTLDEAPPILNVAVMFALLVWLLEDILITGTLGQAEVFGLAVATFVLMSLGRTLARAVALELTPVERCLVLGNHGDACRIAGKLHGSLAVKAAVIGRVSIDRHDHEDPGDGPPVLGDAGSLALILAEHGVERVIIAPDDHDQDGVLHAIRLVKALGVKVSVLPRLLEVVGSSSTFDDIDGITLLGVRRYGLTSSSDFLKRAMDISCAAAGLLALAPIVISLAIAIKLDSRGPVFFRQRRIGRGGCEFDMLKFRSMVPDADEIKDDLRPQNEAEGLFKISDDPRITRVGRFLRKSSLDELPQLFNVLKGDMSLVGPRPLVPDEDALIEGWQRRRLAVKPGMTGLWQIFGSARIPMNEMVKIDYLYGANWSLWLDLKILFRTVPYVFRRRGL
jgi:exopolysaccharide biosynthesis polyprenyl glycosylphosphotransferase